jgi:uncharacterized protein
MHRFFPFLKTFVFIMVCLWTLGCATSPPTKFYMLSPLAPSSDTKAGSAQNQQPKTVRVDGVVVPGYLDRDEIVTRISENQIHLADLNRWGEPLRNSLTNILALNLSRLLPTENFAVFAFKCPSEVNYQIIVEIIQMDGSLNGDVQLMAQWSIFEVKESNILVTRESYFKASEAPADYGALVAAQSRLVEALSREIAKSLQADL